LSYLASTQTNKQTDKQNRQKHNLLRGGRPKYAHKTLQHVHENITTTGTSIDADD